MVIFGGFGVRKKLSPYSLLWQASRYAVRPRVVEFRLEKSEGGWWERLLRERARQHWLRWPGLMITLAIILQCHTDAGWTSRTGKTRRMSGTRRNLSRR